MWNTHTDETDICTKYKKLDRKSLSTGIIAVIVYVGTLFFFVTLCVPDILNIVMPLDKPRLRIVPTPLECFLDQQKYFYVIISDIFVIALAGTTTLMATETMFMVIIQHVCGLFTLARWESLDNLISLFSLSIANHWVILCYKITQRTNDVQQRKLPVFFWGGAIFYFNQLRGYLHFSYQLNRAFDDCKDTFAVKQNLLHAIKNHARSLRYVTV